MGTFVYSLESKDFTEMEQALNGWDHHYRQISPGAFCGSLLHTQTASLGIFRNRWERAIHYQGSPPQGTVAWGISLVQTGEAHWMGQRAAFDDLIMQRPGTESDYISAPLWDSVVFAVPEADLVSAIANLTTDDPQDFIVHGVAHLAPQSAAKLRRACLDYFVIAACSQAMPDAPSMLPRMAQYLVELTAGALVSSRELRPQTLSLHQRPHHLIRKAEEYCLDRTDQRLRIGQLCREMGISDRTLRDTFHRLTAMSPLAYLKNLQLNRVYRTLRHADPSEALIKQVAITHGFFHFGQFSQDYKRLFGELPSETLQRA